jgi:hypothetical protein
MGCILLLLGLVCIDLARGAAGTAVCFGDPSTRAGFQSDGAGHSVSSNVPYSTVRWFVAQSMSSGHCGG